MATDIGGNVQSRRHERKRAILGAQIRFADGASTVDCLIRNLSDGGALIELDAALTVPEFFDLKIKKTGLIQRAQVRWRETNQLGVQFVENRTAAPSTETDLEAEIRKLKAIIIDMRRKADEHGVAYLFNDDAA